MRRRLLLLAGAAGALTGARRGRAAAPTAREQRAVAGFDELSWSTTGELSIEQTGREALSIEAEPKVLAQIVSAVQGRRLTIAFAPGSRVHTQQPIRFRLEVRALRAVELLASGDATIGALDAGERFALRAAGSGNVRIARLAAGALDLRIDGSSDIAIDAGTVEQQRVVVAGSGNVAAPRLASRRAEVAIDGSGDVTLAVAERLQARISGSGDIRYRGEPQVAQAVSGSGSVARQKP